MDKDKKCSPSITSVFVLVVVVVGILLGIVGFLLGFWTRGASCGDLSKCDVQPVSDDASLPPVPPEPTRPAK